MNTLTFLMCDLADHALRVGDHDPELAAEILHLVERITEEVNDAIQVALRAASLMEMTGVYTGSVN